MPLFDDESHDQKQKITICESRLGWKNYRFPPNVFTISWKCKFPTPLAYRWMKQIHTYDHILKLTSQISLVSSYIPTLNHISHRHYHKLIYTINTSPSNIYWHIYLVSGYCVSNTLKIYLFYLSLSNFFNFWCIANSFSTKIAEWCVVREKFIAAVIYFIKYSLYDYCVYGENY